MGENREAFGLKERPPIPYAPDRKTGPLRRLFVRGALVQGEQGTRPPA